MSPDRQGVLEESGLDWGCSAHDKQQQQLVYAVRNNNNNFDNNNIVDNSHDNNVDNNVNVLYNVEERSETAFNFDDGDDDDNRVERRHDGKEEAESPEEADLVVRQRHRDRRHPQDRLQQLRRRSGADVRKLISSLPTMRPNKLECLHLAQNFPV